MKLYVVRHGQTDWNLNGLLQGNTDIYLNENGINQAKEIQQKLKDIDFDLCYSSPLSRAYDTAKIICGNKTKIEFDSRLEERELGEFEGKHKDLYDGKFYWDLKINSSDRGVESPRNLLARVTSFYEDILSKHSNETILIVSHGAVVRCLNFVIKGYDDDTDIHAFDVPNCHVFEYEIEEKEV